MTDFEKLKQMDIQDIHHRTRITMKQLENILNKNYKDMDSVARSVGFIKIIEREFHLNLQDLLDEYNAYQQQNNSTIKTHNPTPQTSHKAETQTKSHTSEEQKSFPSIHTENAAPYTKPLKQENKEKNNKQLNAMNIEISMPQTKSSLKSTSIIIVSFVIIVLLVVGIYFISFTPDSQSNEIAKQNNIQKQIVENDMQIATQSANKDKTKDTALQSLPQTDKTQHDSILQNEKAQQQEHTLTITPKVDVWFAWFDTTTKIKGEKYTKTSYTMQLKNNTLFKFGYMVLTLELDGQSSEYEQRGITYMLYDMQQGFKMLSYKEYRALGGQ